MNDEKNLKEKISIFLTTDGIPNIKKDIIIQFFVTFYFSLIKLCVPLVILFEYDFQENIHDLIDKDLENIKNTNDETINLICSHDIVKNFKLEDLNNISKCDEICTYLSNNNYFEVTLFFIYSVIYKYLKLINT